MIRLSLARPSSFRGLAMGLLVASTGLLAGCSQAVTAAQAPTATLIEIGGDSITRAALDREMTVWADSASVNALDPELRREAYDRLVLRKYLSLGGRNLSPEAKADFDLATRRAEYRAIWKAIRARFHPPEDVFEPAALEAFREERYQSVKTRQILSATREAADEIVARLEAGEDFQELAKTESIDIGSAAAGGRMYPIRHGEWFPNVLEVLFALDEGEIGGPVPSRFGWHVLLCEEIHFDEEDRFLVTDEVLRKKIIQYSELSDVDPWVAEERARHGITFNEAAVVEAIANILPVPASRRPPMPRPGWAPSEVAIASSTAGIELSLNEFIQFYPILDWLNWPRVRNEVSIRSAAERLLLVKMLHEQSRSGESALTVDQQVEAIAERDTAVGQAYLDFLNSDIEITEEVGKRVYEENEEAFMTTESISLGAIGVAELELADELFAALTNGSKTFAEAAEIARARDPEVVYVPHMPFLPRGAFPQTDSFIFGLEEGEIADPLPTASGYMIYKVLKRRPPRKLRRVEMPNETFQERVFQVLALERRTEAVAKLREQFDVVEHEAEVRRALDAN